MKPKVLLIILMAAMAMGCAKSKTDLSTPTVPNQPIDTTIPGAPTGTTNTSTDTTITGGSTVEFKPVSVSVFEDYVKERPLNNPSNFKINVNMVRRDGVNTYSGDLHITYTDNGYIYRSNLTTGSGTFKINDYDSVCKNNGFLDGLPPTFETATNCAWNKSTEYAFNNWFTAPQGEVFRSYYSDSYGAVVLIIDGTVDLGDGAGSSDIVSGKVYYKNFPTVRAPESPTRCWFVTKGPYSCATFKSPWGEYGNTFAGYYALGILSIYPADGYQLLGTFSGLSRSSAFNE